MHRSNWIARLKDSLFRDQVRAARPRRKAHVPQICEIRPLAPRTLLSAVPVGPEFRVNSYTTGTQTLGNYPVRDAVGMDAAGNYVVVWRSNQTGPGIYAQRYNAAGVAQGSEFRVNTYTTIGVGAAAVGMDADGDFVVTWSDYSAQDGSGIGIHAQRFNAAGVAQGSEFQVNSYTTGNQHGSAVALDALGNFVVTWEGG